MMLHTSTIRAWQKHVLCMSMLWYHFARHTPSLFLSGVCGVPISELVTYFLNILHVSPQIHLQFLKIEPPLLAPYQARVRGWMARGRRLCRVSGVLEHSGPTWRTCPDRSRYATHLSLVWGGLPYRHIWGRFGGLHSYSVQTIRSNIL